MGINKDISYCSGVGCAIRKQCVRYLPQPPEGVSLDWVAPMYGKLSGECPLLIKK